MDTPENLAKTVSACRICRDTPKKGASILPHEPNPVLRVSSSARLCIAGQAPGTLAHQKSKPFDDPSGVRLRQWMGIGEDLFYDESKVSIVPMGFCFPGLDAKGGDLPPRPECAPKWRDVTFGTMPQIELILVIGQYAQKWHLGKRRQKTLTETVQNWRSHWEVEQRPRVLPLPHPSWRNNVWLKKNPWFEIETLPALRAEVQRLI